MVCSLLISYLPWVWLLRGVVASVLGKDAPGVCCALAGPAGTDDKQR